MKAFRSLGLLLLVALLGVSWAQLESVPREDTVIFDIDASTIVNPNNFNYLVPGTLRNHGAHQALWEPLFILNYESGEIEPWLGETFEPNEGQDIWTLSLRDGVTWSDSEAFNADDVVFTIQMLLDDESGTLADAANMQQWVESVEKVDDLTVQFNLNEPNPRFQLDYFSVRIWGNAIVLPEHIWADKDPFTFTNYDPEQGWPVGTGPYQLASTGPNQIVWDRRDDWWGAEAGWKELPEPQRLVWQITGSEENKAQLMSNNQLDSLMNVTLGAFEAIQARNPNATAWVQDLPYAWADPCPRQLTFNTQVEPWNDPNMRQAVSHIIDRNQIIAVAYEGTSVPSSTIFVQYGGMEPYIDAIVEAGYGVSPEADVEAGQALIEAAGWTMNGNTYEKDGQPLSVDIMVNNSSTEYTRTVDIVVEQLRAAGINATSRPLESSTMDTSVQTGDFVANYNWDSCGSVNEPWASMNRYTTNFLVPMGTRAAGNNYIRWDTEGAEAYTEIVDQIGVMPLGDPEIVPMVVEAYGYIAEETPIIPLAQASKLVPFDTTYWTGWPTAENNYNHPATWWHSTHQIIHNLERSQ